MQSRFFLIPGIIIVVIAAVVVFTGNDNAEVPAGDGNNVTIPDSNTAPALTVLSEQNQSGENGTAAFVEENGKLKVIVNVTGAPAAAQPAHIHKGSCPTPGDVAYPLNSLADGHSATELDITADQLKAMLPLAINVHKSPTDIGTYVACGNIQEDHLLNVDEAVVGE